METAKTEWCIVDYLPTLHYRYMDPPPSQTKPSKARPPYHQTKEQSGTRSEAETIKPQICPPFSTAMLTFGT
jgi:hypothetical protein